MIHRKDHFLANFWAEPKVRSWHDLAQGWVRGVRGDVHCGYLWMKVTKVGKKPPEYARNMSDVRTNRTRVARWILRCNRCNSCFFFFSRCLTESNKEKN